MRTATVIQRLRQIMSEGPNASPQDGASIAEAYAGLCAQANERLRNAADSLKRGMVSEALRIAESEPLLLDLSADLDFVGVENWAALCGQRKWAKPQPLDGKAIQLLNEAYSSGQALEPLLKTYRRTVREQKTKECVRLLRRIAKLDAANSNWLIDLKGFEERRVAEIRNEYKTAQLADDAETLAALMVEINDDWQIPRDTALRDAVRDAARAVYEKQAMAAGRVRIQAVAKAYAALDFEALATAIAPYEALLREGYLTPDASMRTQFDEAKEWLQEETKKRAEEQLYSQTLSNLRLAVEKGNALPLDETLNVLARFNRPIPDRLEERARALIETHRLAVERIRKRRFATAAMALLLVAAAIAVILSRQHHTARKGELQTSLSKAYQSQDLDALTKLLSAVERDEPRVFRDPEIQPWIHKRSHLAAEIDRKRVAFDQTLVRLESMRQTGFAEPPEVVEGLIAESKANVTPGAAQGRLAAFMREWGAHNEALQVESDRKAAARIDEYSSAVDAFFRRLPQKKDELRDQCATLREKGRELDRSLDKASPEQKARLSTLIARLDAHLTQLDAKERQLSAIRNAATLRDYLDGLKTYDRAFPEDPFSKTVSSVLAREIPYFQLLDSPVNCSSNNPFWFDAVRQRADPSTRSEQNWPAIKNRLLSLNAEKRYTDLWECQTRGGKAFIEGRPTVVSRDGIKKYEGMVYIPKPTDIQPEFALQALDASSVSRADLMPHCEFVAGLISLARFSTPARAYPDLLTELQKLGTNTNISPLLRLRLADLLLDSLTELVGADLTSEWYPFRQDLKTVDPELHWLCSEHRDVKQANLRSEAILNRLLRSESTLRQSRFMNDLRDVSLKRNIKWVAYADFTNGVDVVWKTDSRSPELWTVRTAPAGTPEIIVVSEAKTTGWVRYRDFIPGEPLFAPTDGQTTRAILSKLLVDHGLTNTANLKWVHSWPANFRP